MSRGDIQRIGYEGLSREEKEMTDRLDKAFLLEQVFSAVHTYNHRAQIDIAKILLAAYPAAERHVQINISNRLFNLFFEFCDQVSITFACAEHRDWEKYVASSNAATEEFYRQCSAGISVARLHKAYSMAGAAKSASLKFKREFQSVRHNLQELGRGYLLHEAVSGSNAVKHGYKVAYRNPDRPFFRGPSDHVIVHAILEIGGIPGKDETLSKRVFRTGQFASDPSTEESSLAKLVTLMETNSQLLIQIAEAFQESIKDPYFYLKQSWDLVRVPSSTHCPCGRYDLTKMTPVPYAQCHGNR